MQAPPGGAHKEHDIGVDATKESLIVGGHKVYAAYFEGGMGYRIDKGNGVAVKDEPESMYAIFSGKHFNSGCCFVSPPSFPQAPWICGGSGSPLPVVAGLWKC